jgi:adenine-specific DNA-methyltransferase
MMSSADFGLAIWDGKSPGTKRNIEQLGKRCRVVLIN